MPGVDLLTYWGLGVPDDTGTIQSVYVGRLVVPGVEIGGARC